MLLQKFKYYLFIIYFMKKLLSLVLLFNIIAASCLVFAEDTDGDGVDDVWEARNFGNISQKEDGDFDNDGKTNLEEFQAGTDPVIKNKPDFLYITTAAIILAFLVLLGIVVLSKIKKKKK